MTNIRVVDYVPFPGGRYETDGPYSGEWFRRKFLVPELERAISRNSILEVDLDGAPGYGISFLEESFGGLVRVHHFTGDQLRRHLRIVAHTPRYEVFSRIADKSIDNALMLGNSI